MYRYSLLLALLVFGGCSNMTFNATMCDQINSDPNAIMPKECRAYSEEKAQKAFDKVENEKQSQKDRIEFNKEEDR